MRWLIQSPSTIATAVIDANVLVGLLDDQDKWHDATLALRNELSKTGAELLYFDCVINETISVLARRTREQGRPEQLDMLLDRLPRLIPIGDINWSSEEIKRLYTEILELIRSSDGRLNFHDALIALLCKEQGVSALISFDQDFDELAWLTRIGRASQVAEVLGAH